MNLYKKIRGIIGSVLMLDSTSSTAINLKNSSGVLQLRNKADSAFANASIGSLLINDGTYKVTIAPPTLSADYSLTLPDGNGSPSQVLTTDGDGVLSWTSAASTASCLTTDTTSLAFGSSSPVAMFTLPANAVVKSVQVIVDTPFNGTAPTMSVGISGSTSKYVGTSDVDLKTSAVYEIEPGLAANGSTEALIITYSADSSSAGAARVIVSYSVPA
jgi:hypothetical protein